ncbi:MAG: fructosamine kinase family protein [Actinobacteria bacterium]|nr:fructosamine kinase family protein [Actinomycetota bacterium]
MTDPALAARLGDLLGTPVGAARSLGGQHGVRHYRLSLADGRQAFAKLGNGPALANAASNGFAAEAAGLRWLGAAEATGVPSVLAETADCLVIDWVDEHRPRRDAAARFGQELAGLHAAGAQWCGTSGLGAPRFGAPWPGVIAGLPLPNDAEPGENWPDWYAARRVLPYAQIAAQAGTLSAADVGLIEAACARFADVAGPAEPPARLHGDCWSGNVLWSGGRGWLIDPAAHGGHRETDLAMLALFGAPHLDAILAGYQAVAPLADGWRERVPLHQLHPLLVHVCLFGTAYREPALAAARSVLARLSGRVRRAMTDRNVAATLHRKCSALPVRDDMAQGYRGCDQAARKD